MKVTLTKVRLSFPDLFVATPYDETTPKGQYRYNATFLIEPGSANAQNIERAISQAAAETWEDKGPAKVAEYRGNSNKFCYLNGDTKDYDGYEGFMYLASHRKVTDGRPTVLDRDKSPLTESDGRPYAGCYVNAIVDIYTTKGQNIGIRCGLQGIQFVCDGDAFTGAGRANADDFEDLGVQEGNAADDLA